jgi:transposase
MDNSTIDTLTPDAAELQFFMEPEKPLHRQYEALRAFFVQGLPAAEVAERFGYSYGAFRVLCTRFRKNRSKQDHFFKDVQRGPRSAPVRDRLREQVVAMRKRNMSVYEIQIELESAGVKVSINTLSLMLKEEGFARLPRRKDDERPSTVKPVEAPVADVRCVDLSPRSFRTRMAGLFFFVPLMEAVDTRILAEQADLPGSEMIPADQALRSLLALKLIGTERKSHVMSLVLDEGLAMFAGLNAIPKRSFLASYSSRVGRQRNRKLMDLWFDAASGAGLQRSGSLDVDFHTVPTNSAKEPLDKHYVSKRSRSQQGVLVFLARDAEHGALCYSNAAVPKAEKADEIRRLAEFWKQRTGRFPDELAFDSQLTTHDNLAWLQNNGIRFLTLRRRTKKMLARIYSLPASQWTRVTLKSLTRTFRNPKVLDEAIPLKGYPGLIRQLSVVDLGHEQPTILLTNDTKLRPAALITRYAQRMLIENGIAEAIHFFHIDALSSMVDRNIDLDLQITLMASAIYRLLADKLPANYRRAHAKTIFRDLLDVGGIVKVQQHQVVVTLDRRAHNTILADTGLADRSTPMPWFGGKRLVLRLP